MVKAIVGFFLGLNRRVAARQRSGRSPPDPFRGAPLGPPAARESLGPHAAWESLRPHAI